MMWLQAVLALLATLATSQGQSCAPASVTDQRERDTYQTVTVPNSRPICVKFQENNQNSAAHKRECEARPGRLVSIKSEAFQDKLVEVVQRRGIENVFTGLEMTFTTFYWLGRGDGSYLIDQGCYDVAALSNRVPQAGQAWTTDSCRSRCTNNNFELAGFRQSATECFCGYERDFNVRAMPRTECNNAMRLLHAKGGGFNLPWRQQQPNNVGGPSRYQGCVVLETYESTADNGINDEACEFATKRFICELPDLPQSRCSGTVTFTDRLKLSNNQPTNLRFNMRYFPGGSGDRALCYAVSERDNHRSFFEAHQACRYFGINNFNQQSGSLLYVSSQALYNHFNQPVSAGQQTRNVERNGKYWLGLTRTSWNWHDGTSATKVFLQFATGEPIRDSTRISGGLSQNSGGTQSKRWSWKAFRNTDNFPAICQITNFEPPAENTQPTSPPTPPQPTTATTTTTATTVVPTTSARATTTTTRALNACEPNPCQNDGTCSVQQSGYSCQCKGTWTGENCENRNPCQGVNCNGRGRCTKISNLIYNCVDCTSGFSGRDCEIPPPDPCNANPCNSGNCVRDTPVSTTFTCNCPSPFTGSRCETTDLCLSNNPCTAEGHAGCAFDGRRATCRCKPGWTGNNCETRPTSPCDGNPCGAQGSCTITGATYRCTCRNGWTGNNCQTAPNPCRTNTCQNGGTCVPIGSTGYTCQCDKEWSGRNCENGPTDPCLQVPCLNGGTCRRKDPGTSEYQCTCRNVFTGPTCAVNNPCGDPNACNAPGLRSCENNGGEAKCNCVTGWGGIKCDVKPSQPCNPSPCLNQGQCTTTPSGFNCACGDNWKGKLCDVENPCFSGPCQNFGVCEDTNPGEYKCNCATGYTGIYCEVIPPGGHCSVNPCQNGGQCVAATNSSFSCTCAAGFSGRLCADKVSTGPTCPQYPCINGGVCWTTRGVCNCTTEFEGTLCQEPVSAPMSDEMPTFQFPFEKGVIVAIVVAGVALLVGIIRVIVYCCRRNSDPDDKAKMIH